MPKLTTIYFKELEYSTDAVIEFPAGLPGFEDEKSFLFIEQAHTRPLVFVQSLLNPSLCFLALPVAVIDPDYQLILSSEEQAALGLDPGETPRIGPKLACFVLMTLAEDAAPTVNLMSPIVVHLPARKGIQAIPASSEYSLRHPLALEREPAPCS